MRRLAIAIVLALAGPAVAQPAEPIDTGEAGQMFQRGRDLLKQGQIVEACALFDQSYQLDPAPGTGINLAACLEQQGQLRRAWELFDKVAHSAQNVQSRTLLARERASALLARLATVVIRLADPSPAGLVVRLGDHALAPSAEIRAVIEPGDLALVATAPGLPIFTTNVHATAGATLIAEVPALEALRPRRTRLYLASGLGAAGALGLGLSLGFAVAAKRSYDDAFDHGCTHGPSSPVCVEMPGVANQGRREIHLAGARADLATGFVLGGALLVGAAATVFVMSRETVQIAPLAQRGGLGLGIVGKF